MLLQLIRLESPRFTLALSVVAGITVDEKRQILARVRELLAMASDDLASPLDEHSTRAARVREGA